MTTTGLHAGLLLSSALARLAAELQRHRRGRAVHQQRDARQDLVAGHVLRQRQVGALSHGHHQERVRSHQPQRLDYAESPVGAGLS